MSYTHVDALDENGIRCEVFIARADMPEFGAWFEDEGRRYQRVPSMTKVHVTRTNNIKAYDRPRKRHVEKLGLTPAPHYDSQGVAQFQSRREVNEYIAAVNDNPKEGRKLAWNPDGNE